MTAVIRTIADLRAAVAEWRSNDETIGLVPTMGALHDGHLSLVARSRADNKRTIATLFVNPTQFGPKEDLAAYPRDEAADLAMLQDAKVDALYAPSSPRCIPRASPPQSPSPASPSISTGRIPSRAFRRRRHRRQQAAAAVRARPRLFRREGFPAAPGDPPPGADLDIPVQIVGVPTVREADGLALSSRNRYLSNEERTQAATLPRMLKEIAERLRKEPDAVANTSPGATASSKRPVSRRSTMSKSATKRRCSR